MKKVIKCIFVALTLLLCNACNFERGELGSEGNPIKFYFTPSSDASSITVNSTALLQFLEKETGMYFDTEVPTNYITVVEAFGSKKADVAIMNSFGYLLANKKFKAEPKLKVIRYGKSTYKGQILASKDSGIKFIKDLQGKKFAFTDASSTSGYLFPLKMIKDAGVELGEHTFAMKHDNVITMIYQGQVEAGATFYSEPAANGDIRDARIKVLTQFPDVEEKVKIIGLTEDIPNDPVVFRQGIEENKVKLICDALISFAKTKEGNQILNDLYGVEGFEESSDSDYNVLREMIKATDSELEKLID